MNNQSPSSYTLPKPCNHLIEFKLKHGLSGYNTFKTHLNSKPSGKTSVVVKLQGKEMIPRCGFCFGYQGRFYICLICYSVSCLDHLVLHAQIGKNDHGGHDINVDVERCELYCCVCCDQVYDPDFDRVVMSKHLMNMPKSKNGDQFCDLRFSKRRLGLLGGSDLGSKRLSNPKQVVSVRDQRAKSCIPLGLRGLNNLGSTCFMNSVLQALLHAPPLRNYFLNNRHSHESCRKRSLDQLCLPCDIDVIFAAVFSGNRTPYSPAHFLYSWWQHSANLATYEQQDAHEFFISMLGLIHEEGKATNPNKDNGDCQCIAHRVFSGLLRSDVTCTTCGFTSTTYDPCVDISLDLNSADLGNKTNKPSENTRSSTLVGSLNLFTRPEKLGSDQKLFCQNCQERQNSLKQMSIRRLPLVLCLHIKRFEHSPTRKISRKIDRFLQFPFSLDMSPYLSSSIVRKRYGNRIFSLDDDELDISAEFEVFAVVAHSGMLESGHYVTYLRLRNQWYRCDDAWINNIDEETVRASQCYLLYYVQKGLYHKASDDLSCLPISPHGDSFLPIAGCC